MRVQPSPVKAAAGTHGIAGPAAGDAARPTKRARRCSRSRSTCSWWPRTGSSCRPPCLRGPVSAASTSTRPCCRAGAAPRRSSTRCSPATRPRASPSCRWTPGLDTGPMIEAVESPIAPRDTAGTLTGRLARRGRRRHRARPAAARPATARSRSRAAAPAGVTYAGKIDRAEAMLDWRSRRRRLDRQVRAFDPAPGAVHAPRGRRRQGLGRRAAGRRRPGRRAPSSRSRRERSRRRPAARAPAPAHRAAGRRQAHAAARAFAAGRRSPRRAVLGDWPGMEHEQRRRRSPCARVLEGSDVAGGAGRGERRRADARTGAGAGARLRHAAALGATGTRSLRRLGEQAARRCAAGGTGGRRALPARPHARPAVRGGRPRGRRRGAGRATAGQGHWSTRCCAATCASATR